VASPARSRDAPQRPAGPRRRRRPPARAPRRRPVASGGRAGRIRWDRVGRVALLAVLSAILLLYIAPISTWLAQSATAADYRAEVRRLEAERVRLSGRIEVLEDPAGLEREARRLGMVRRGERAYIIEGLPPD
jgi:cell division protein FtsB